MARTLIFFLIFWIILLISLPLLLPVYLLNLFDSHEIRKRYIRFLTSGWSRFTLFTAGIKIKKSGLEHIPSPESEYVIISNHQGNFDIPVLMAVLPFSPGFVAKKELTRIPLISSWMNALECLPIERSDPRASRKKIYNRIRQKGKNPLILFPEGTRSRGLQMVNLKTGSLKLLFHHHIDILPVTINGTYKSYEEKGKIQPADVMVIFHPLIRTSSYEPRDIPKFLKDLRQIISGGLK